MLDILAVKNGFRLFKEDNFYFVGLPEVGTLVNLSGTKEEVINELERWKKEVDYNNDFMLEVENAFLDVLTSR